MLSLPCHRQKGGCELFQLSKPGHTSDEEEKRKKESCQSTQKHKGLWSREPLSCSGRPGPDEQACPVSFCSTSPNLPSSIWRVYLSHPVSVTPTDSQMGRERRRGCCVAVFYLHPGQEAMHPDLYSPRKNYMLLSENPKTLIYI